MTDPAVKGTILIVDDNPTNLAVLYDYLKEEGFAVFIAKSGEKAIQQVERIKPDIILLDVLMPGGIDGFETCHRLKANPNTRGIPVIFMTALSDTVDKVKGFNAGAVDYVTKPFQQEEVLARINAHLTILRQQAIIKELSEKKLQELRFSISQSLPHELRTPLTTIMGYSQLIAALSPEKLLENAPKVSESIYQASKRLYRLIENYILFTRVQVLLADEAELNQLRQQAIYNPQEIIEKQARDKAAEKKRKSDLSLQVENALVYITVPNLEKIVQELVDNAFTFSSPGSPVAVQGARQGDSYLITITDAGHGMSTEQLKNIGAYMQFDRHKHEQQGSGLGLTLATQLVELHGGTCQLESVPEQGTTVYVRLRSVVHG
ncbi:MAG: hybrid sensor histidine kinase/response regulator [Gemmatimonadetes bacterium]|nr:MAG: hybrid sensor histidine kinase/response regulator [Gemmatimonadota bacterium]